MKPSCIVLEGDSELQNQITDSTQTKTFEPYAVGINASDSFSEYYVVGAFLLSLLVAYIVFRLYKDKKLKRLSKELTEQEQRVIALIKSGKTNNDIADELSISISTVKTHINNIYRKLNISSRKEL